MMAPIPTFADFYRAIHGRAPFPWQARLARRVTETNEWPNEVGVPTGLGKTACLDIAVWWLASQADRTPSLRSAPTRIWWVVNRRLLVDSTHDQAERLARILAEPDASETSEHNREVVATVAERLRSLSADPAAPPLDVIRLRGGIASRTPADPSQPTVILCTLPMYGSRLLFRGYGSSRSLRPIDAAMAGTDSLVLLDEAHLAPHLKALMGALAECTPGAEALLGKFRSRANITALTATGDASADRFDLDEQDRENPTIVERLNAAKPVEVWERDKVDVARLLADAAGGLLAEASQPASCLVFANTPRTARETFERLRRQEPDAETLLLTGLNREREAEQIRACILDPATGMAAARFRDSARERDLIVVATQTLEVGADLDAEYLVTEACGVRALTQRLGRLNRLGRHAHARAVYVHAPPPKRRGRGSRGGQESESWPVYGEEPKRVLARLQEACPDGDGVVDLPPARVAKVLGDPHEDRDRAPEVLLGILWEWTKTTARPYGEAPVEPYFSGIRGADYSVSLIWRVHVPEAGQRLWPRASDREAVDVSIREVREALQDDEDIHRLAPDGVTVESTPVADLQPGDQIVLAADRGRLDRFGWNPDASGLVMDASLPEQGLSLDGTAIRRLCGVEVTPQLEIALGEDEADELDQSDRDKAVAEILDALQAAESPPGWGDGEWDAFTHALRPVVERPRREVARLRVEASEPQRPGSDFGSENDELSLTPEAVELDKHGQAVGAMARIIAERIGLPSTLVEVVERAGAL
ncbi:MAG: type I-U CRISPR-associated helicase/endonuclease Cas3, partial [Gemmatimonadetes bacterium]|nr:type I-U CRISPR-associated helicase/endonuclease Cas3 [Gemmatimonadota bacterium]